MSQNNYIDNDIIKIKFHFILSNIEIKLFLWQIHTEHLEWGYNEKTNIINNLIHDETKCTTID